MSHSAWCTLFATLVHRYSSSAPVQARCCKDTIGIAAWKAVDDTGTCTSGRRTLFHLGWWCWASLHAVACTCLLALAVAESVCACLLHTKPHQQVRHRPHRHAPQMRLHSMQPFLRRDRVKVFGAAKWMRMWCVWCCPRYSCCVCRAMRTFVVCFCGRTCLRRVCVCVCVAPLHRFVAQPAGGCRGTHTARAQTPESTSMFSKKNTNTYRTITWGNIIRSRN